MTKTKTIQQIHEWTHDGDRVLPVKCLNRDGTAYGGFKWPKSGPVSPDTWSRNATCNSGGLFGWPWGMGVGDGRTPDACADWLVFAVKPENVIGNIEGCKAKAVPGEDGELPEVVFYGTMSQAMLYTQAGRIAWVEKQAKGKARSEVDWGSASASGYSGSASASGDCGSASASGDWGAAAVTGNDATITVGAHCAGVATGGNVSWVVVKGAKLMVAWFDANEQWRARMFDSDEMGVSDGDVLRIDKGEIVEHIRTEAQ